MTKGAIMCHRKKTFLFVVVVSIVLFAGIVEAVGRDADTIDLAGKWSFRLDPANVGQQQKWFQGDLPDTIKLPGSTTENGYGDDITIDTKWTGSIVDRSWFTDPKYAKYRQGGSVKVPFWLSSVKHYVGPAWYVREVIIPQAWQDKRIELSLQRCHWQTTVWVDDKMIGSANSLSVPHEYDLTDVLTVGTHRLSIRVDNTVRINVGRNAHSVSDHTQTNWNGIIGLIELCATDRTWIEDVQVYPDIEKKTAKVKVTINSGAEGPVRATIALSAESFNSKKKHKVPVKKIQALVNTDAFVEVEYPMTDDVLLWDEFSPNLYRLTATITGEGFGHSETVVFGMRKFATDQTQFTINNRKTFLRGTLECNIFPLTGYPPMDIKEWSRIIKVAKSHGLNHFRFHSHCPPEAAFVAADTLGFYFQVEGPFWTAIGDGKPIDDYVFAECDRILTEYGNHPSFVMLAYGNEPGGSNQKRFFGGLIEHWKKIDPRHLYTSASGWPIIPENDFHSTYQPRIHLWGAGLGSRLHTKPPETVTDYRDIVSKYNVPIVSHEIGQWCVYPNFNEIKKYTGVTRAYNFEIFRDTLAVNNMLDQADDFLLASGKLQTLCYKEEIESALRTPGFGGFQLLDLHDFPGQGTALVGVLDPFWEYKGYVTAAQFNRFCGVTVPLARMEKRIWTSDQTFVADIEVAHFGPARLEDAQPIWTVTAGRRRIASGKLAVKTIDIGNCVKLGRISVPLTEIDVACQLKLSVRLKGTDSANDWDFWVYPKTADTSQFSDILITDSVDEKTLSALKAGGKVMFMPAAGTVKGDIPPGFSSIFWNTAWTRNQPPHTLGILCDPKHPALADFPTEYHSNWQWQGLLTRSQAMILDDFAPAFRPIVQVIDDWVTNRRLGIVFEADVNGGKLLVCAVDLRTDLANRPAARQMRYSLLKYMDSNKFKPRQSIDIDLVKKLLKPVS